MSDQIVLGHRKHNRDSYAHWLVIGPQGVLVYAEGCACFHHPAKQERHKGNGTTRESGGCKWLEGAACDYYSIDILGLPAWFPDRLHHGNDAKVWELLDEMYIAEATKIKERSNEDISAV